MSEATFQKHDYAKPVKRKVKPAEDPRPPQYRGTAVDGVRKLLDKLRGEQLRVSLLLDSQCQRTNTEASQQPSSHSVPDAASLKETTEAFKQSIQVSDARACEIERCTHGQRMSSLWFDVRWYRITASMFGAVLSRRPHTPPDSLVLRLIQLKQFSTAAMKYGIDNEEVAVKEYVAYQHNHGHPELVVSTCGFLIDTTYSCLGASPDGAVYDPSDVQQPFGFLEVKCPYSVRGMSPTEACATSGFCCELDAGTGQLKLKESHQYYAQVQGQMGIGERLWCDFVVYTTMGLCVQRIPYNEDFWINKLRPKLV